MRHAKSSWDNPSLVDHDRPLNQRGKRDAPIIATSLETIHWLPELILSSSSKRTWETFTLMNDIWNENIPAKIIPEFYGGGLEDILVELAKLDDEKRTVLVLGHNPGWENAVSYFTTEYHSMTTANAALLEAEAESWMDAISCFRLVRILRPKELIAG